MRRVWWAWFLGAALAGCQAPIVYVPAPDPVAPAPPTPAPPPVPQPPPDPPPDAPVAVAELVARLAAGSTVAEADEVFGRPPDNVAPAFGPAPETRRWFVTEAGQKWMVYAVFLGGKVTGAGSAKVQEVP